MTLQWHRLQQRGGAGMQAHGDPSLLTLPAMGSTPSCVLPGKEISVGAFIHVTAQPLLCFVHVPLVLLTWKWDSWVLCECECMCMSVRFTLAA